MNGLPTSLKIGGGQGLSYSPYGTPAGERLSTGLMNILQLVELERRRKRDRSLLEKILSGTGADTEGIASLIERPAVEEKPVEKTSLLANILGRAKSLFDVTQAPTEITPLEQTIAEAFIKQAAKPKTVKEKLEEKLLTEGAEGLTDKQLKLIGAYIPPGERKSPKDIVAEKLIAEGKMTDDQLLKYIGAHISPEEKLSPEQRAAMEVIKGTMRYRTVTFGARPLPEEMQVSERWAYETLNAPYPGSTPPSITNGAGGGMPSILEEYQKLAEANKNVPVQKWNEVLDKFLKKHNITREQLLGYMDSVWSE